MAIKIRSENPTGLLEKIKAEISAGQIKTWAVENRNGKEYFSHITPDKQWAGKAWLRARVSGDTLVFNIIRPENAKVSSIAYAVYHGRFTEMVLAHFDQEFSIVWATAMPEVSDLV